MCDTQRALLRNSQEAGTLRASRRLFVGSEALKCPRCFSLVLSEPLLWGEKVERGREEKAACLFFIDEGRETLVLCNVC